MSTAHDASAARASFRMERKPRLLRLVAEGVWTTRDAASLDAQLQHIDLGDATEAEIDGSGLERIDSAGAWLLVRTKRDWEERGKRIGPIKIPAMYETLMHAVEHEHTAPPVVIHNRHTLEAFVGRVGRATIHGLQQGVGILGYIGRVTVEVSEAIYHPRGNLRVAALIHQVEETGINALPIVGLLSFLIGVVLAYQGADQLKRFGAELLTVDLVGVGLLREIAGLITAIIVAGRSGSAFTAQIGTMRVNEEIDAMQTIGINTVDALVLPRVIGLAIALPLLTFYSDMMGLLGGAVMCYFDLGITIPQFMRELQTSVSVNTFMVGMIKAPVFAFIIALVGCFEGLQVERNAASVGKLTTRSVVESIFLVIVLDAGFSIMFSILGI
ncbi:MAG TPA: MlaE family lipid ABC transporter permease subunit [Rhizomicrobium sp.]|nr:MlaE family lipid ABC transporter permease subunit [Rhizomicrobium sp.]